MAFGIFILVVVLTIGTVLYQGKAFNLEANEDFKQPDSTTAEPSATPGAQSQITAYKDGTYSADGIYTTPENQEKIGVTVTLKDNIITAADVQEKAVLRESQRYQEDFISGYKEKVIGKNINDVKLSRVSGSSLTSRGFNNAINQIKQQAKA